jgi:CHAT domain-containing protein
MISSLRGCALYAFALSALLCPSQSSLVMPHNSETPSLDQVNWAIAKGDQNQVAGDNNLAGPFYRRAYGIARQVGDENSQANALFKLRACELRQYRYTSAISSLIQGKSLAVQKGRIGLAGAAELNLSTLYFQLGDLLSANRSAQSAIQLSRSSGRKDLLIKALINSGSIEFESRRFDSGRKRIFEAISIARNEQRPDLEALGWEFLEESAVLMGQEDSGELWLGKALALRLQEPSNKFDLSVTLLNLANAKCREGRFREALEYLNRAVHLPASSPHYYPIYLRAKVHLGLGQEEMAAPLFASAIAEARRWRIETPISSETINGALPLHDLYISYAHMLAAKYLRHPQGNYWRNGLNLLAEDRGAAMLSLRIQANSFAGKLPKQYFRLLNELSKEEARETFLTREDNKGKLDVLRADLRDFQNSFQFGLQPNSHLKSMAWGGIDAAQNKLSPLDALMSFSLGERCSYLWVLTSTQRFLYRLPPASDINEAASVFISRLRNNRPDPQSGTLVSKQLFGQIDNSVWSRPHWLIVTDSEVLKALPVAALPDCRPRFSTKLLVDTLSIRSLPSETTLMWPAQKQPSSTLVVVGDPIYNNADPRRTHAKYILPELNTSTALARLAGSIVEIQSVLEEHKLARTILLDGEKATRDLLAQALEKHPSVVHFAVHIVSRPGHRGDAAIALSLDNNDLPALLTSEDIMTMRVPGSLVVMNGCSSESANFEAQAGLIGLSRAWILAGASAVIETGWATPDESGKLFSFFYRHLYEDKDIEGSPPERTAIALQRAQNEVRRLGGYLSMPNFWANYSVLAAR